VEADHRSNRAALTADDCFTHFVSGTPRLLQLTIVVVHLGTLDEAKDRVRAFVLRSLSQI